MAPQMPSIRAAREATSFTKPLIKPVTSEIIRMTTIIRSIQFILCVFEKVKVGKKRDLSKYEKAQWHNGSKAK